MSKELEEAIVLLNNLKNTTSTQEYTNNFNTYDNAIETVLQALEELQQKERNRIIGNIKEIKIEDLEPILKPYYIPKEKVEKVFETKIYNTKYLAKTDWTDCQKEVDYRVVSVLEVIKQELLEEK